MSRGKNTPREQAKEDAFFGEFDPQQFSGADRKVYEKKFAQERKRIAHERGIHGR